MKTLSGWQRIGIVITIAWIAAVITWLVYDINSRTRRDTLLVHWNDHKPKPWEMDWTGKDIKNGYVFSSDEELRKSGMTQSQIDQLPITLEVKRMQFATVLAGPPAILWILGGAFTWIAAGFRKK